MFLAQSTAKGYIRAAEEFFVCGHFSVVDRADGLKTSRILLPCSSLR